MSKFTVAATTSHALSVAAMEEASRFGQRTADIDHLFLAFTVSEQSAGQVLRSCGITLDAAREAVAAQQSEQLAALGVQIAAPEPGGIVFHKTGGYEWSDRAVELLKRASEGDKRGDAAAVLRELVAEPSGMIDAILHRLNTTPELIVAALDEAAHYPALRPQFSPRAHTLASVSEAFAPASPERVWELLATPSHMPDWEPGLGSVTHAPEALRVGDVWTAFTLTERPDGKPTSVKPNFMTQRVELVALEEPRLIEWRFSYPEAPKANTRHIRIEIEPAAGGSQLHLTLAWERNSDRPRRPLLRLVMRPVHRLVLWMQLSQLGSGISRTFR